MRSGLAAVGIRVPVAPLEHLAGAVPERRGRLPGHQHGCTNEANGITGRASG